MFEVIIPERLDERLEAAGLTQSELARRVGVTQPTIAGLKSGRSQGSKYIDRIARELGTTAAYLTGETDDPAKGAVPVPSADVLSDRLDLVGLREIDLTLGMGATYLDVPVTTAIRYFSRDWLRAYTKADPDHLFFAQGIGDSQSPTILDSDLLLIDVSQNHLNLHDKFWAVAYGQMGAVRRLRGKPDGSIEMLCDNPLVRDDVAYDGELHVIGRVVAIVRKL
ncbi:MAG: helix-turn-helix transcriptional regulator [Sphingomonadaceae bacterium]|nr:helix-turn-helix transcriptional regulator [Sphingomonadaceae bacterium]